MRKPRTQHKTHDRQSCSSFPPRDPRELRDARFRPRRTAVKQKPSLQQNREGMVLARASHRVL
jgi:hypothetical protein